MYENRYSIMVHKGCQIYVSHDSYPWTEWNVLNRYVFLTYETGNTYDGYNNNFGTACIVFIQHVFCQITVKIQKKQKQNHHKRSNELLHENSIHPCGRFTMHFPQREGDSQMNCHIEQIYLRVTHHPECCVWAAESAKRVSNAEKDLK